MLSKNANFWKYLVSGRLLITHKFVWTWQTCFRIIFIRFISRRNVFSHGTRFSDGQKICFQKFAHALFLILPHKNQQVLWCKLSHKNFLNAYLLKDTRRLLKTQHAEKSSTQPFHANFCFVRRVDGFEISSFNFIWCLRGTDRSWRCLALCVNSWKHMLYEYQGVRPILSQVTSFFSPHQFSKGKVCGYRE